MILKTDNLCFGYNEASILKNINFAASNKEIISLIGPNGSGKSTLLRCLCGLLRVKPNMIFVDGKPIERCKPTDISQVIAFLPQFQERINGLSVFELVAMGRSPYHTSGWIMTHADRDKIDWAMRYMSLAQLKDRPVDMLSGGERQRVFIAMILAQDTPLILLDEPVTYMDLKHQWDLLGTIKDLKNTYGKTVISVFHDINHAMEVSDEVYLMKDGAIFNRGSPEEVVTEKSISEVYEICAHVCRFSKCKRNVVVPAGC